MVTLATPLPVTAELVGGVVYLPWPLRNDNRPTCEDISGSVVQ